MNIEDLNPETFVGKPVFSAVYSAVLSSVNEYSKNLEEK